MELSDFSLPMKSTHAEMGVKEIYSSRSEIYMTTDFVVKGGPLGG